MSYSSHAVFLSYASQDAEAAKRICEALRAAGVEVWFDQNELVGGDQWDAKIRGQIGTCALFVPLISANTQARLEGYFRLEWKLAAQRTHTMADEKTFLLPVVIDATRDPEAKVPAEFRAVQWTKLPGGETPAAFVARVKTLLSGESDGGRDHLVPPAPRDQKNDRGGISGFNKLTAGDPALQRKASPFLRLVLGGLAILVAGIVAYLIFKPRHSPEEIARLIAQAQALGEAESAKAAKITADAGAAAHPASNAPIAPDQKSVAVLAFANLSDDKGNEYFSDGISEELLNVLAKVPGLKVTARTSSFHFKGKDTPIPEIARELSVAYVIEGSVRKSGDKVRITAQLIKAADGFHVWSDTFTRDLKDIFAVQDEIAGLIAKNLELKLGNARSSEVSGAEIEAYRLYWEARQAWNRRNPAGYDQAEALLNRALELAPRFAKAHAALADVWELRGEWDDSIGLYGDRDGPAIRRLLAKVDEALALDPQCAEAYASRGNILGGAWQYPAAETAFRTAIALNPNFATAHQWLGRQLMTMGRLDEALVALKRAAELDPLSQRILDNYAWALRHAGRYSESLSYLDRALVLQPDAVQARSLQAAVLADLGRGDEALAALHAVPDDVAFALNFRLSALGRLGRKADVERLLPGIRDATPRDRCMALALLGRTSEALATLKPERIFASDADLLLFEPAYDSLRSHPEWNATMAAIGFTDAQARAQAWRKEHAPEKPETKK